MSRAFTPVAIYCGCKYCITAGFKMHIATIYCIRISNLFPKILKMAYVLCKCNVDQATFAFQVSMVKPLTRLTNHLNT